MGYVTTSDGVKLFYEEKGSGRPLVLIHGWSCSGRFFTRNTDALSEVCRVINVDLRGHGRSDKPEWGYRISRMAKDIRDLIEELDLNDTVLLGWSMGAAVIFSYFELFSEDRVSGLVIVDQSPRQYYSPEWKLGQAACYDAEALSVLCTRLEYDVKGVAEGTVRGCMTQTPSAEELEFFVGEILHCPPRVQSAIMTDHTNLDWRDLVPRITLPTLVLVGRKSRIFPWQGSAWVGERLPGARTVFFEESGHMLFYEEQDKFNEVVGDWVAGR